MKFINGVKNWVRKRYHISEIPLWKVLFFQGRDPNRYIHKLKTILYYDVINNKLNPIRLQKFCFFYLPEVPDFGSDFTYLKLGNKEKISNPKNYFVIFEADLEDNISKYNKYLFDYSGLYALYKNSLIKEDYLLLIHYDTQILHKKWIDIISARVRKNNVIFAEWAIDNERAEICKWIYSQIDNIFLSTHNDSFLSFLKKNKFYKLPTTSQFACRRANFNALMEFLLPIYEYILLKEDLSFRYAHLLERAWGLFFALNGYEKVAVIRDSHNQADCYGETVIDIPILTTALQRNVNKFSEILERKS